MPKWSQYILNLGTAGPATLQGIKNLGFALTSEIPGLVAKYVRVDAPQAFTDPEKLQGRENIGAGTIATQDADDVEITGGSISDIVDLAVADGGTGASTAGGARTNLGLGNVDNTSDADKPISVSTASALSDKQPLDAMLTAIAALVSASGKFLAFTEPDVPAARDIVGTVTQSAGVPTGAIVERGSNANGEYVRYADGTQICWHNVSAQDASFAAGAIWASPSATDWILPAAFVAPPSAFAGGAGSSSRWFLVDTSVGTQATIIVYSYSVRAVGSITVRVSAIGRWF